MKRILCFGDSNTYGTRPNGGRFDENTRWPMRLNELLGPDYAVIEEGFGGRTTVFDDPVEGEMWIPALPCSASGLDAEIAAPLTGEAAKRRVFGELLGLSPARIAELAAAQVI